jgi:hypothetical protein
MKFMVNRSGYTKKMGKSIWVLFCLFSIMTFGCISGSNNTSGISSSEDNFINCGEKRPEICTMDYVPVCAELDDGSRKTYSNACGACSDKNVIGYQANPCP